MTRLALILALAAAPVVAMPPPLPDCGAGQMTAAERRVFGLGADDWQGYFVDAPAQGFALYVGSVVIDARAEVYGNTVIIEHCASRTRLAARFVPDRIPGGETYAAAVQLLTRWGDMASRDTLQSYSFDELAAVGRSLGAQSQITRDGYESCGCRILAQRGQS